jgi:hypothetical protein
MNCEEFRRAVGAEPSTTQLEVLEHAAGCAECARYRTEMRAMDGLILKALSIDVTTSAVREPLRRSAMNWRIAATVLVSIAVFSLGWLAYPRQSLAEDIVQHVLSESRTLDPSRPQLDPQVVQGILRRAGVRLADNDLSVSFAMACRVRGQEAPHLVVRTSSGPVTVLVLSHEAPIAKPQHFDEQGFVGTLVPAPRGIVAVLGRDVPVDDVTQDVLRALSYDPQ